MKRTMAILLVLSGTATSAFAQSEPRAFVRGFGGLTFMTETAGIFGAGIGVRTTDHVEIFGEMGRLTNILPRSLQQDVDAAAQSMGSFFGGPLTIDLAAPALYGLGGLRVSRIAGARLKLYAEAGAGAARGTSDITARVGGVDVSRDVITVLRIKESETRALLALGGGVVLPLTGHVALNLGYRYMRIFTDDPRINTGTISAGIHWGF